MKKRIFENLNEILEIFNKCDVCYLSMIDNNNLPYVLPFNFGYKDNYLYFHCNMSGKKIETLTNNKNVCIAFSTDHSLTFQSESVACSFSMKFRSAIVYGKVEWVDEYNEKEEALNIIMGKYTSKSFTFSKPAVNNIGVFKVKIDKATGKESGY